MPLTGRQVGSLLIAIALAIVALLSVLWVRDGDPGLRATIAAYALTVLMIVLEPFTVYWGFYRDREPSAHRGSHSSVSQRIERGSIGTIGGSHTWGMVKIDHNEHNADRDPNRDV